MAVSKTFDFLVIGGGSAGFNAARVAADLGKSVAIVDGARELGGLCILRGCMPSKTLLHATDLLHQARHAKIFGLRIPKAEVDMKALHRWKKHVIDDFASYRQKAMQSDRYTLFRSQAHFVDPHTVALSDGARLRAKRILIATGSRVSVPPHIPGLTDTPFWTSDEVLDLDFVPKSVIVLGGGIVACELAQFLNRIGTRIIQIQRSPHILKQHSAAAAVVVEKAFTDEGIQLHTDTRLEKIARTPRGGVRVAFAKNGQRLTRTADYLFNALGREPNTAGLKLDAAGVATNRAQRIVVNRWQQTSQTHIYAGGDVCGPHDIVHLAVAQGELAARHAFFSPAKRRALKPINPRHLLEVVFTDPPIAAIGETEATLIAQKTPYLAASYPFDDHGKSILMNALRGHVKILAEPKRGRILGAEIVGPQAGELIHCLSAPLTLNATVFDLLRAPWYHPTLAEILSYPLEEIAEQIGRRR